MSIRIPQLLAGGLITNYHCTSECRHCLYRSSPRREKGYVEYETAREIFHTAKRMGCSSMHIGGGESFLDADGLMDVLRAASRERMEIEYVETNSIWFSSPDNADALLRKLQRLGLAQLLVSISPLHNEFTPFRKVRGVMAACSRVGISVFPWVRGFLADLEQLDENIKHSMAEYTELFGPDYLEDFPNRYWVHWGGRALESFRAVRPLHPASKILGHTDPCRSLLDTSHFHFDLNDNYVPGLCAGLAVRREDAEGELDQEHYPILNALVETGVRALAELAASIGVEPSREQYMNKCDLCDDLRAGMVRAGWDASAELAPVGHYA